MKRDEEGPLLDANDWRLELIEPVAASFGLPLMEADHEIIRCTRECFEKYGQHACRIAGVSTPGKPMIAV